ncbi:dephospho-CoA kinase [Mycolicibacterium pulveris]|uniref:Dephospho-CoA kinase n=1 Tax=Mycolicibacterium pulveris TaxID=36813 RepID=A0A7I7USG1_MYCPV|nr:dephospho-CoA kinase [Mycolicibacterium pulveris]MCV6982529.1 dephospho-CoA kinase [Mycolicibacterium pulveris]BBY83813.1 dephospho-CoA kinase [Mycolicibacterium pulveris]
MLRIGLTGGIGAGKSTVSAVFSECGGVIVDGDVIAREVVEPGTEGLKQLVEAFGEDILLPHGALNRPALAAKAFRDDKSRALLNEIVHPLVGKRREEIIAAVSEDTVVVEDIPLLVETGMAPLFPLVVVVTAPVETRVARLIKRGMDEADARARIAAQATEEQRRAIADVLLDNSGSQGELVEKARDLWYNRVLPLAHNIRTRTCAKLARELTPYRPTWPEDAARIIKRVEMAGGAKVLRVDHIGSTAVVGMDAKDVIDVQATVASLEDADALAEPLAGVGFPRRDDITADVAHTDDPRVWRKRLHCAADPGRPANIHIRVDGWPNQQFALLFTDWLRANPGVREEYLKAKRHALSTVDYVQAKEPWFLDAYRRAWEWASTTGWRA